MKPPANQAESPTVAFIGGGNMARSLIGGMIARGADPACVRVAEPVQTLRDALQTDFGVRGFATAAEAVEGARVWCSRSSRRSCARYAPRSPLPPKPRNR
jgi:pyrroline-5-carboxylate reductase